MTTPVAPKRGRALLRADGGPLGEKFAELIDASIDDSVLEPKTRELLYVALMTTARHPGSLRAHVGTARAAGASKDEIVAAIMMAGIIAGVTASMDMLPVALEVLDTPPG
jgi:alkylhydroperoxidase/carboxymuconolactone decarboxylase family protein YurZ